MDREELLTLHAALGAVLALPDSVRELPVKWLTPAVAKPNGRDPHPPAPLATPRPAVAKGKPRKQGTRFDEAGARAAEQKLLGAIRENPGLGPGPLARALAAPLSSTKHRLERLADTGAIERGSDGGWRAAGGKDAEARPMEASPS